MALVACEERRGLRKDCGSSWSEDLFWASLDLCKCLSSLFYVIRWLDLEYYPMFFMFDEVWREGNHKVGNNMTFLSPKSVICGGSSL